jgi:hypothetical protein
MEHWRQWLNGVGVHRTEHSGQFYTSRRLEVAINPKPPAAIMDAYRNRNNGRAATMIHPSSRMGSSGWLARWHHQTPLCQPRPLSNALSFGAEQPTCVAKRSMVRVVGHCAVRKGELAMIIRATLPKYVPSCFPVSCQIMTRLCKNLSLLIVSLGTCGNLQFEAKDAQQPPKPPT